MLSDSNDALLLPPFVLNHTGFPFCTSVGKDRKESKKKVKKEGKGKDRHKGHKVEEGKEGKKRHCSRSTKSNNTLPLPLTEEWMDEVFLAELESYDQRHTRVCIMCG